jgi:hypothetical protein
LPAENRRRVFAVGGTTPDGADRGTEYPWKSVPGDDPGRFKKTRRKPHVKKQWCIPASRNGEFIACEEIQAYVPARKAKRNAGVKSADWQFATDNARIKLKWLYPNRVI